MNYAQRQKEKIMRGIVPRNGACSRGRLARIGLACSLALILVLLAGCSAAKSESAAGMADASSADMAAPGAAASGNTAPAAESLTAAPQAKLAAEQPAVPAGVMPAIGADSADGFNRKLMYRANLVMPVEDYAKSQTELRNLVALSGAYILQFSESVHEGERGGSFTIKVAAGGFVSLLDGLETISPSMQRNVSGEDVTEEYVDLESRLKAKQAVEARLLAFMEKATRTEDLLAFSNELAKVQGEIEQLKGRMRYLDQNVAYSTIELRMYQQNGSKPLFADPNRLTLGERIGKAWSSSLNVLAVVLQGILVFLAAALPIAAVAAVAGVPIYMYRKRRQRRLHEARTQLRQHNAAVAGSEPDEAAAPVAAGEPEGEPDKEQP